MRIGRLALCAGALLALSATSVAATPAYVLSNVNLRSGPATTNDVVVLIPAGSVVEASNCTDGWCAVTWQDKNGFTIQTALDMSGRPHPQYGAPQPYGPQAYGPQPRPYPPPPGYVAGPSVYAAPPPPPVYYGPGYYGGYGWGWRRHWW
jgi:hypothetical protein